MMLSLLKAAAFLIGHIPLGLALFLGKALGSLAYRADSKRRNIVLDNLGRAYGNSLSGVEKERIARGVYVHLATVFFEFMRVPWLKAPAIDSYVACDGLEHLQNALRKKRGVIFVTAHLGDWELMAAYLGLKGYPVHIVARELDSPLMEEFVKWVRTRSGNRIVSKNRAMRRLIKALSENAVAGILLDQNVAREEGVFVDFFGSPACTNKGPMLLASATGAAVLPIFILRDHGRHTIYIGKEVGLANTGDRETDALENTRRCTKLIEEMIRKRPQQWFWVHRRWKTRPDTGI